MDESKSMHSEEMYLLKRRYYGEKSIVGTGGSHDLQGILSGEEFLLENILETSRRFPSFPELMSAEEITWRAGGW